MSLKAALLAALAALLLAGCAKEPEGATLASQTGAAKPRGGSMAGATTDFKP